MEWNICNISLLSNIYGQQVLKKALGVLLHLSPTFIYTEEDRNMRGSILGGSTSRLIVWSISNSGEGYSNMVDFTINKELIQRVVNSQTRYN